MEIVFEVDENNQIRPMDIDGQSFLLEERDESETTSHQDIIVEGSSDQLYFCNTCNVAFHSIVDHISDHHSDQDVIIEMDEERETTASILDEGMEDVNTEDQIKGEAGITIEDEIITEIDQSDGVPLKMFSDNGLESEAEGSSSAKEKYSCDQCDATYSNAKSLCAHKKCHKYTKKSTNINSKTLYENCAKDYFKCEVCNTSLMSNKSLQLHKRMHDPKTNVKPASNSLSSTEKSSDPNLEKDHYRCILCDTWIKLEFRSIHDAAHLELPSHNCTKCNRRFTSAEDLEMHKSIHTTVKPVPVQTDEGLIYPCSYCQRRFLRPYEKVKHERIHTGEKPFKCDICGKTFRVSYCKTLHQRTHVDDRPYDCKKCGKKFKSAGVYNYHILTHSEVRAYKCDQCPKTFKTPVQLAGHRNTHSKPFQCSECNRPFASLYAVRQHTLTHQRANKLTHSCHLCGASYARAFALKDHMKEQHDLAEDVEKNEDEADLATQTIIGY